MGLTVLYTQKTRSVLLSTGFVLVYGGPKVSTKEHSLFLKTGKLFSQFLLSLTHLGLHLKGLKGLF